VSDTPKAYVAGYFLHKDKVREVQNALREQGWDISFDWTNEDASGKTGADLKAYARECATKDLKGVWRADMLVLLHETEGGCGMWTEMGMALICNMPVVVIGGNVPVSPGLEMLRNIFYYLPLVTVVDTLGEALVETLKIMDDL
jgi:hypothetical protein